jgi:UDP-N-acetyl-D-galactosamine dehydrogenase
MGYHPEIILAGRRLNDSMGEYVASQIVKLMIKKGLVNGEAAHENAQRHDNFLSR